MYLLIRTLMLKLIAVSIVTASIVFARPTESQAQVTTETVLKDIEDYAFRYRGHSGEGEVSWVLEIEDRVRNNPEVYLDVIEQRAVVHETNEELVDKFSPEYDAMLRFLRLIGTDRARAHLRHLFREAARRRDELLSEDQKALTRDVSLDELRQISYAIGITKKMYHITLDELAALEDTVLVPELQAMYGREDVAARKAIEYYLNDLGYAVPVVPNCSENLMIEDIQTASGTLEYLDLVNRGDAAADVVSCALMLFDTSSAYDTFQFEVSTRAPGDTLRIGTAGAPRVDQTVSEATFRGGSGTIAVINHAELPLGTPLNMVPAPSLGYAVTWVSYSSDSTITDFDHRNAEMTDSYCFAYADRLAPGSPAEEFCAEILPSGCGQISAEAEIAFEPTSVWNTGYNAQLQITNTGTESIRGWTLAFTLDVPINSLWNGQLTGARPHYTAIDAGNNSVIPPGQSRSFGLQVQHDTVIEPSGYALNEVDCQAQAPSVDVAFETTSVWATGYNGQLQITNTGEEAIRGWRLGFTLDAPITNLWNGDLSGSQPHYTVTDAGHNGILAPGETVTVGFQVQHETVIEPSGYDFQFWALGP